MNARTLIITAGALVALAAPAVASAKLSPAAQYQKNLAAKKHAAKQVFKRHGEPLKIYAIYPAPGVQNEQSLAAIQAGYNLELIEHGLDPIAFPDASTAPAATSDASSSTTPADSSSTASSDSSSAASSDATPSSDANFAAAPATSMVAVDDSADC